MADAKPKNMDEEVADQEKSTKVVGARKRGGMVKRASGGMVPGSASASRPDRRARGGATSDMSPLTAAGNVKEPGYVGGGGGIDMGGVGSDKAGPKSNRD